MAFMSVTVFAKTKKSNEGRAFRVYLARLKNRRTGEDVPVRVQFREGLTIPTLFPCNILIPEKGDANLSEKTYEDESGTRKVTRSLWVNRYEMGDPYEDHSLDDYA